MGEAILCGKYVTPLLEPNKVLIGATHEFKPQKLEKSLVMEDLKLRTYDFASYIWENGEVDKVTCGYRVQSHRNKNGRMPIVGRLASFDFHPNAWLLTGLSSRGLVYHGIYGNILCNSILEGSEDTTLNPDLGWWKDSKN